MINKKVHICNHCHQFFQNETEAEHPIYRYYKKLWPDNSAMLAWTYLNKVSQMIGAYDVLQRRHPGTVPTICGVCGIISDDAHQITPHEEDMLSGFERVTHPSIDKKWFTEGSLRFFNTAFCCDAVSGFFITKEGTYFSDGSRTDGYTIRRFCLDGVETIGEFLQYDSCEAAAAVAGQHILACAVFWNHMMTPCEDPEKGKGECSEMHIMATERLLETEVETLISNAFPMHWETFAESHGKSLRWCEDERDKFFDELRAYHMRKEEEEEEGEAA